MRRPSSRFRRRSRFAGFGQSSGRTIGVPGPGSAIGGPADYRQAPAPGSYKHAALGVPAHTHDHHALNGLNDDDHSAVAYLLAPRAKLRIVAPAGAPYTSPKTAIEACAAGDCVLIMGGTYDLTATITLPDHDITIIGVNREAVVLNNTTAGAQNVLYLTGKHGVTIRDLTLQAAAGNTGSGIYIDSSDDVTVDNVAINSVELVRSIYARSATRARIERVTINTGGGVGIYFYNTAVDCHIIHCRMAMSKDGEVYGVIAQTAIDRFLVAYNSMHFTGAAVTRAIYAYNADDLTFERNLIRIDDPAPGGAIILWLRAHTENNAHHEIVGNRIILSGNLGTGIYLQTTAAPWTLDECIISGNGIFDGAVGIHLVDARVTDTLVHGNKVATCTAGVSDAGTNTQALDND